MFITFSILLILASLFPGVAKLQGHTSMRAAADHFDIAWHRYRLIGVLEVLAAVGVGAGFASRPLGVAAALGFGLLLLIALSVHVRTHDPVKEMIPALVSLAISAIYLLVV